MAEPKGFPSLKAFVDAVGSAKHSDYAARAASKVAHEGAFTEMQAHILRLYDKVEARHSFMDQSGGIFDCIPIEQQPALRGTTGVLKPQDLPPRERTDGRHDERKRLLVESPHGPGRMDRHGNEMQCPPGTIPMRRITLEVLTRFATLKDFLQKGPGKTGRPPRSTEPPSVTATHRYAHAYQGVKAGGGHSYLSLWDPTIGPNQIFSLSQQWYVGGSGANLQTVECGWQVYPGRLNDSKAHLFTYWTADDYTKTGCYDLTCSAFVQLSPTFAPGMALNVSSLPGGVQYIIELAFWHTGGAWWLYYNGCLGTNVIGYYPDTLFKGGALASYASEIDYGGETVGTTSWPPMGSGAFANTGWEHAAYQEDIGYWTPQGGKMIQANLTPSQPWPADYTAIVKVEGDPWYETLWFGGPGGNV